MAAIGAIKRKHKMKPHEITALAITLLVLCFLTGCASQQPTETIEQICIPDIDKATALDTAEDVLVRMQFTIDKTNTETGYMKTRPLTAGQFFEFWRKDNVGSFNTEEANRHTIRRTVELNMSQKDKLFCINCRVNTQRLSLYDFEERGDLTIKFDRFSDTKAPELTQELYLPPSKSTWIDLGKDEKLATSILKRIEKKLTAKTKTKNAKGRR